MTTSDTQSPTYAPAADDSRKLLWSLFGAEFGLYIAFGAVPGVLLALQVESIVGDGSKAGTLAIVSTIGAVAAMVVQPLVGAYSDRTRSRLGRRAPWLLVGSTSALPLLVGMGLTNSIVLLTVLFTLLQAALSIVQGPLVTIVPDRVPTQARGRFSAAMGLGVMMGTVVGQGLGSLVSNHLTIAYTVIGLIPAAFVIVLVRQAPDTDSRQAPQQKLTARQIASGYWVSPRLHPDFAWAFLSRLLTYVGFFIVYGYLLYILDDYAGLGDDAVKYVPLVAGVAAICIIATTMPAGLMSDRLGRRKVFVLISSFGIGASFMVPLISSSLTGLVIWAACAGLSFGFYTAVDAALITEVLPSSTSYAQDVGVMSIASLLPGVLAPAVAGGIVVATGGYTALFPIGALFAVLGGLAILPVRSVR